MSSLERAQQNPKNQESLFGQDVASKITLQNMAVLNKSFNRRKPLDNGSTHGARAASALAEQKAQSYASSKNYKQQLQDQAKNFHSSTAAANQVLPPPPPPEKDSLEIQLPSYKAYERNRENIDQVEKELTKV